MKKCTNLLMRVVNEVGFLERFANPCQKRFAGQCSRIYDCPVKTQVKLNDGVSEHMRKGGRRGNRASVWMAQGTMETQVSNMYKRELEEQVLMQERSCTHMHAHVHVHMHTCETRWCEGLVGLLKSNEREEE